MPGNFRTAARRKQKRGENAQQRGFACAVSAQDCERFAARDAETDGPESTLGGAGKGRKKCAQSHVSGRENLFDIFHQNCAGGHRPLLYRTGGLESSEGTDGMRTL